MCTMLFWVTVASIMPSYEIAHIKTYSRIRKEPYTQHYLRTPCLRSREVQFSYSSCVMPGVLITRITRRPRLPAQTLQTNQPQTHPRFCQHSTPDSPLTLQTNQPQTHPTEINPRFSPDFLINNNVPYGHIYAVSTYRYDKYDIDSVMLQGTLNMTTWPIPFNSLVQ
mgnify:CR=1 FL=1